MPGNLGIDASDGNPLEDSDGLSSLYVGNSLVDPAVGRVGRYINHQLYGDSYTTNIADFVWSTNINSSVSTCLGEHRVRT